MSKESSEFVQAHHSLIDPLVEPEPSDETGLNSHFGSTFAPRQTATPPQSAGIKEAPAVSVRPQNTGSSAETNPYRRARAASSANSGSHVSYGQTTPTSPRRHDYPSPPNSASPRRDHFGHRAEAFSSMNQGRPRRSSQPSSSNNPFQDKQPSSGIARSGSLHQRYPGDTSHKPLEILKKNEKAAYRAPHLRKKNFNGADLIDRLDKTGFQYHHEGPYDAASLARNKHVKHSPVAAVASSNEEALRATPRESIMNSLEKHRPLEGVANIPPGMPDRFGRVLNYEEGTDLQREGPGGDYARWADVDYLPGDLKGKGEPSYSLEKALKDKKQIGDSGIEMTTRHRNSSLGAADGPVRTNDNVESPFNDSVGVGRSNTTGRSMGDSLKKRFGSLRRRKQDA